MRPWLRTLRTTTDAEPFHPRCLLRGVADLLHAGRPARCLLPARPRPLPAVRTESSAVNRLPHRRATTRAAKAWRRRFVGRARAATPPSRFASLLVTSLALAACQPATATAPAPSSAPERVAELAAPRAEPLDLAAVAELPIEWSANASHALELAGPGAPAVAALLEGGKSVAALDRATGRARWTADAPLPGYFFTLREAGGLLVAAHRTATGYATLALDEASGKTLWKREGGALLRTGLDGTGLYRAEEQSCTSQLVDPATGRDFGEPFVSSTYEEWPIDRPAEASRECATGFSLLGFMAGRSIVGWSTHVEPSAGIWALDPAAASARGGADWPLGRGDYAAVSREPTTGVYYSFSHELVLARFDASRAARLWEWRSEIRRDGCVQPPWPLVRATRGPAGHEAALLVQDCTEVIVVDAQTGATSWRTLERDAIAIVRGEPAARVALPTWEPAARPYRLFTSDGQPLGLLPPPAAALAVYPRPDGLLVLGHGYLGLVGWDGRWRWAWRGHWGAPEPSGEWLVVELIPPRAGGEPEIVVLDGGTGAAVGKARGRLVEQTSGGASAPTVLLQLGESSLQLHALRRRVD